MITKSRVTATNLEERELIISYIYHSVDQAQINNKLGGMEFTWLKLLTPTSCFDRAALQFERYNLRIGKDRCKVKWKMEFGGHMHVHMDKHKKSELRQLHWSWVTDTVTYYTCIHTSNETPIYRVLTTKWPICSWLSSTAHENGGNCSSSYTALKSCFTIQSSELGIMRRCELGITNSPAGLK